ncbi:hypothetical protein K6119_07955 [Paracrocinitomix mangrovi]|uniref:hypothetical protein n=1 Tax=Paracrocinitomix mangrovi TaxID=2862509 RepID=UPI001C8DF30D|nr:hypothetical protein [Paracrocinitomix mangrovi]UKN03445.1 hypothetical protein K6119_07955 [Paracrocinitomix mangrovi]
MAHSMQDQLKYIELKTGYSDDGPAWIGMVQFSKSGRTIYFNGQAFKSLNGQGVGANYYDLESLDEYWISGVKKDGTDRHWAGGGKIMIQKDIVDQYLTITGWSELDKNQYELVEIAPTDKQYFKDLENETLEEELDFQKLKEKELHKLTDEELDFLIEEFEYDVQSTKFSKARRSLSRKLTELQEEKEKRAITQ